MKILIYGAGVIGCELAHRLKKAHHDVRLLARGSWQEQLAQRGLVIRHYAQFQTTTDRVFTIEKLKPTDVYNLIFVAVQYGQTAQVLPDIAQNQSRYVVWVGNNMDAAAVSDTLTESGKEIAFGFQATGGRRENDRVISIHAGVGMTIGGLNAPLSEPFQNLVKEAFAGAHYRLTWEKHMDAWLKCHMAFILPIAYVCYATDFHLRKASRCQRSMAIDAAIEGYGMLKNLGHPIRPAGSDTALVDSRKRIEALLWLMAKTPLGRLAASDHCKNAGAEMMALDAAFETLRQRTQVPMPNWDALRKEGKPHL